MNETGEILKALRLSRGLGQKKVAELVGAKSYTTVSKWESGENYPQGRDLKVLSEFFNVSTDYILGIEQDVMKTNLFNYNYYPHSISAGLPFVADGTTEYNTVTIPDELMGKYAGHDDIIISKINGDSMDKLMKDGSFIAIKPIDLSELKNGDIVVFSSEYEYSVKYFHQVDDKLIFKPYSHNDCHHEQHYNEHDNIRIHGKVVTYIVNLD